MTAYYTQSHVPSLLVTTNGANARFFDVEEDDVYMIDEILEKPDRYSDREGFFNNNSVGYLAGGEPDVVNARMEQFVRQHLYSVADKTGAHWRDADYVHLAVIVPQHHANTLIEQIHKHLPAQRVYVYYGNHVHEVHPHKVRALFQQALKPSSSHHTHE